MNQPISTKTASRLVLLSAALLCLLVFATACYQSVSGLAQARSERLFNAEREIAQAVVPLIRQDRVPPALVSSVEMLLANPGLGLNYVTLRNTENVTLVSRGRFADAFGWLDASAQQWRGLLYRLLSAEDNRAVVRDEQVVGFTQYGVSWSSVALAAGVLWLLWTALMLIAGGAFCWLCVRLALSSGRPAEKREVPPVSPPQRASEPTPAPLRVPGRVSQFIGRRSGSGTEEYAPIMPLTSGPAQAPEAPEPPAQRSRPVAAPKREPPAPGPEAPPARFDPPAAAPPDDTPAAAPQTPPTVRPEPEADTAPEPAVAPPPRARDAAPDEAQSASTLGDETLDLRFYPIWRGADRRALAGAWAALAWRRGDAELVDAATLTRLAERDGALRAFTHWIARRFSVLHSNWRSLELDTVPIVLPTPTAMLAFADAEAVWQDAIARTDRDPNDLILNLTRQSAEKNPNGLPVRRALPMSQPPDAQADCDVICVNPSDVAQAPDRWLSSLDTPGPPVLFGPVDDPDKWQAALDHERVVWFSEDRSGLCSTRDFARLLARRQCRPF